MKIDHLGIWVDDIELMRDFYLKYFKMSCGNIYINPVKKFSSYFLSFNDGGCRIELMNRPDIENVTGRRGVKNGIAHFAIIVGNKEEVNKLTETLREDGYTIESEPRTTGDGYYESVVLDPEGNSIEITAS